MYLLCICQEKALSVKQISNLYALITLKFLPLPYNYNAIITAPPPIVLIIASSIDFLNIGKHLIRRNTEMLL